MLRWLRAYAHPWNVTGGVLETVDEYTPRYCDDAEWLEMKRTLHLRKVEIWVEWWMPSDERERVEVKRERATAIVLVFRDAERARQSDDAVVFAETEADAVFFAVREALFA